MSESQYPPHQTHSFPCEVCLGTGPCAACNGSRKILLLTCGLCKLPLDRPGPHNCPSCGGTMTALLDGWNCGNCKVFNGAAKEWLSECRSCGQLGPSKPITKVPAPMTYEDVVQGLSSWKKRLATIRNSLAPNAVLVPAEASPAPADEVPSPAEESGKSAIDDLIREAEEAIVSGATVARPLPLLIAKLLREFKGERATCLLQRATIKDLRAKLEQMSKEELWGIWLFNTNPNRFLLNTNLSAPQLMTWRSKGEAEKFAASVVGPPGSYAIQRIRTVDEKETDNRPPTTCAVCQGRIFDDAGRCTYCADGYGPKTSGAAADSAKEEPFLTILNSEPRITELLLSSGDIYDRLYALDNDGNVWTMVVASDSSCEWRRLPSIKESKGKDHE